MNLNDMLSAHTDEALTSLASKGLVRRASRDLQNGLAEITERTEHSATVLSQGHVVIIDAAGPSAARCDCPASSICRHIVLAVMLLRDTQPTSVQPENQPCVTDEVCSWSEKDLMKFSGAGWSAAVVLAQNSPNANCQEQGPNCTVKLSDEFDAVVFISGQGLKGAVYKGPKTRARIVICACAIALRSQNGLMLDDTALKVTEPAIELSATFLDALEQALLQAVLVLSGNGSEIIQDLLFDFAISARAQASPRLSSQLRSLVKQARLAKSRDINFEPEQYLREVAQTLALVIALKFNPNDSALTGVLKRDYQIVDRFELWLLGVCRWTTGIGARGLTAYGFAPGDKKWYSTTDARSAGMDPGFDPSTIYQNPLWGAGSLQKLIGQALDLVQPRVSSDDQIAKLQHQNAELLPSAPNLKSLNAAGALCSDWVTLKEELASRQGVGLRRSAAPLPALLQVSGFGELVFDDFEQVYEWPLLDINGEVVRLRLPGNDAELAQSLKNRQKKIRAVLIEARYGIDSLVFEPISIMFDEKTHLNISNLHFDLREGTKKTTVLLNHLRKKLPQFNSKAMPKIDPINRFTAAALEAAVDLSIHPRVDTGLDLLIRNIEDCGLLLLARSLRSMAAAPTAQNILKTAYIASEIQASASVSN